MAPDSRSNYRSYTLCEPLVVREGTGVAKPDKKVIIKTCGHLVEGKVTTWAYIQAGPNRQQEERCTAEDAM